MGVLPIEGKRTGKTITVPAGTDEDGHKLTAEVQEVEPWQKEVREAERFAKMYKERIIQDYLQSKRERMNGGRGHSHPDPTVRLYMDELGVEDLDDVSAHAKRTNGIDPGLVSVIVEAVRAATEVNATKLTEAVQTVRRNQGSQLRSNQNKHVDSPTDPEELSPAEKQRRANAADRLRAYAAARKAAKAGSVAVEEPPKE
jgi:hypothetical protein